MAWDNKGDNTDTTFKEQMLAKVRNALIERQEALFKDIDQRTDWRARPSLPSASSNWHPKTDGNRCGVPAPICSGC